MCKRYIVPKLPACEEMWSGTLYQSQHWRVKIVSFYIKFQVQMMKIGLSYNLTCWIGSCFSIPCWSCFSNWGHSLVQGAETCFAIFLPALVMGNFMVLNLFLALLLNSFNSEELKSKKEVIYWHFCSVHICFWKNLFTVTYHKLGK